MISTVPRRRSRSRITGTSVPRSSRQAARSKMRSVKCRSDASAAGTVIRNPPGIASYAW
jgi:hypothetical protein